MFYRKTIRALSILVAVLGIQLAAFANEREVPPEIFGPGTISGPANDGSPTFTPDGNVLFFSRSGSSWSVILESHRAGDGWSAPQIASFSGEWSDEHPVLAPDGSYLVFVSLRPAPNQGASIRASHLWRVDLSTNKRGALTLLPETVNISPRIFRPSLAADGTLYFMAMESGKKFRLFRSLYTSGAYQQAEPLSFSDGSVNDVDPDIAPDGSFLIFSSDGRTAGDDSHEHLFVVFKKGSGWGPVLPIHYFGEDTRRPSNDNEGRVSRDGRVLYFSSDRTEPVHFPRSRAQAEQDVDRLERWDDGNSNVWYVPLAPILESAQKPENSRSD
jgi:Tol biopolymer transport system component